MHTITVASAKGGTAKTTTALAIAFELAQSGLQVAIADCDPQATATIAVKQRPVADPLHAAAVQLELALGEDSSEVEPCVAGKLWLMPGGRPLATATKAEILAQLDRAPRDIDVLVIDTPPTITAITNAAIERATLVIVPLQPALYPASGMYDTLQLARSIAGRARIRALFTLSKGRRLMTQRMAKLIEARTPGLLFRTHIPDDAQCEWAAEKFVPVTVFNPKAKASVAYRALVAEIRVELFGDAETTAIPQARSEAQFMLFTAGGDRGIR